MNRCLHLNPASVLVRSSMAYVGYVVVGVIKSKTLRLMIGVAVPGAGSGPSVLAGGISLGVFLCTRRQLRHWHIRICGTWA